MPVIPEKTLRKGKSFDIMKRREKAVVRRNN